jgi:hypothetical protein
MYLRVSERSVMGECKKGFDFQLILTFCHMIDGCWSSSPQRRGFGGYGRPVSFIVGLVLV